MILKFKRIHKNAKLPTRVNPLDAGFDVYAIEETLIPAKSQSIIHTGIQLADVITYAPIVIQAWSRSGLDAKFALHVGAGIIDQGYRGEILIVLKNTSNDNYLVEVGDKVAQLVPVYIPDDIVVEETDTIIEADRNNTGGVTKFAETINNN